MTLRIGIRPLFFLCALVCAVSGFASHRSSPQNVFGIDPDPAHSLAAIHETLGPKYVSAEIVWALSDRIPGVRSFDTENDRKIAEIEGAGLRVFPTLIVGRGWMNGLRWPPEGGARSVPPSDLRTTPDSNYGYSESYFNFLTDFIGHYRGHFDYIMIEHRLDQPLLWSGTVDEYLRLLFTAYKAIKKADPNVIVTHAGFDSTYWGAVVAKDWLTRGTRTRREALDFGVGYSFSEQPIGTVPSYLLIRDVLEENLNNPSSTFNRETLPMVNKILDGISGSVDAINLHYHNDARYLFTLVEWLRERASRATVPYAPRILSNHLAITALPDLGCETADHFSASELDRHARMLFKRLHAARTAKLDVIVVSAKETVCASATFDPYHVDLFDPARPGVLRPAGEVFGRFIDITSPMTGFRVFSPGPELFALWWDDAAGRQSLFSGWSDVPGGQEFTLLVSRDYANARITDYAGNSRTMPVLNGDLRLSLNSTPVFVQLLLPEEPLSISAITPSSGLTAGGTSIAITGTSFASGATVKIGGAFARNVRVVSPTRIEAESAPHASGTFDVVVTNPDGSSAQLTNGFTYIQGSSRRKRGSRR